MTKQRHHFVFVKACGCPAAVLEAGRWCRDEDAAWRQIFDTRARERAAVAAGLRLVHVEHDTYCRHWHPLMLSGCPHQEVAGG